MDAIYYTSGTLMTIIFLGLIILTIVLLVKPHLVNDRKRVKKHFSRLKILLVGVAAIVLTLFSFGTVMAATEPESVKQTRLTQEAAKTTEKAQTAAATEAKVKADAESLKAEAAKPQVKVETKLEAIVFESTTQETSSLPKGQTNISTAGVNGERTMTESVTYVKGLETKREVVKNEVTKAPVAQVTQIGTYVAPVVVKCNPNYSGCVPNVSYDLNCPDIGYKVKVLGYDQYHLDADKDGYGCDSY